MTLDKFSALRQVAAFLRLSIIERYTPAEKAKALRALSPMKDDWSPADGCGLDVFGSRLHVGKSHWRDPERETRWRLYLHEQRALYAVAHPSALPSGKVLQLPRRTGTGK